MPITAIPFSNLNRSLTTSEASGDLSVACAMVPARRHQVPADHPHWTLSFFAPATPSPKPSAKRSAPRPTPPLTAA